MNRRKLLQLSTAVKPHIPEKKPAGSLAQWLNPGKFLAGVEERLLESLGFIGEVTIAFGKNADASLLQESLDPQLEAALLVLKTSLLAEQITLAQRD